MEPLDSVVWQSGAIAEGISAGIVHIWRANLNQPSEFAQHLAQTLSPDERARADRLRFEQHQQRSRVSRGILRTLLGRYLNTDPTALRFNYEAHGKPVLVPAPDWPDLQFNLAHSQDLVVYAIALGYPVGIDVEYQRSITDITEIAQRFFSKSEQQALRRLAGEAQKTAFFQYWTAKEAVLKATGQGLTGLANVEFSLPDRALQLQGELAQRYAASSWQIRLFQPGERYSGAIAIPLADAEFLFFEW